MLLKIEISRSRFSKRMVSATILLSREETTSKIIPGHSRSHGTAGAPQICWQEKELVLGLGNDLVATRTEQPVEYMGTGFTGGKGKLFCDEDHGSYLQTLQTDAEDMAHSRTLSGQRAEIASLCSVLEVLF